MILGNLGRIAYLGGAAPPATYEYLFEVTDVGVGEIGFSTQRLAAANTEFGLVKRSSDGATDVLLFPTEGSFDLTSMMQTAAVSLGTWAGIGDVTVQEWYNQGTGADVVQTTIANQPYIVQSGVLEVLNGFAAVYYDEDHYLVNSSTINLTQPCAWNITMKFEDKGANLNQIPFDSGPAGTGRQIPVWYDDFITEWKYYTGANISIGSADFNSHNFFADFRSPTQLIWIDNVDQVVAVSGANTLVGLTLGSRYTNSSQFKGHMQEITAWDSDKSSERGVIYTNVVDRY